MYAELRFEIEALSSLAREISPTGEGVNPRKKALGMRPEAIVTVRTELHSVSTSGDLSPAKKFLLNRRRYLQRLFEAKTQLQSGAATGSGF